MDVCTGFYSALFKLHFNDIFQLTLSSCTAVRVSTCHWIYRSSRINSSLLLGFHGSVSLLAWFDWVFPGLGGIIFQEQEHLPISVGLLCFLLLIRSSFNCSVFLLS